MKIIKCRKTMLVLPKTPGEKMVCRTFGNPAPGSWFSMTTKHITLKGNIRKATYKAMADDPLHRVMYKKILEGKAKNA